MVVSGIRVKAEMRGGAEMSHMVCVRVRVRLGTDVSVRAQPRLSIVVRLRLGLRLEGAGSAITTLDKKSG